MSEPTLMPAFLLNISPHLFQWLCLSTALFCIGIYGVLTRRDAVGLLIALEIALNSVALNFVIFNSFLAPHRLDGAVMAIFIIAVAAAEVVVAMAIFVSLYRERQSVDVEKMNQLRDG